MLLNFAKMFESTILDNLPINLFTDQPTTCPKCGIRTQFYEIVLGSNVIQIHNCRRPSCKYEFIMMEDWFIRLIMNCLIKIHNINLEDIFVVWSNLWFYRLNIVSMWYSKNILLGRYFVGRISWLFDKKPKCLS